MIKSHKWHDKYQIPGGHVELGERMEDAVKREIKEETGLDVHDIRFLQVQENVYDDAFYKKKHFIFLDYSAKTDATDVTLNEEGQEYVWVTLQDALKLPVHKFARKTLEFALKSL